ncbi:VTC domain-containing protein [Pseudomonadota bacterium]
MMGEYELKFTGPGYLVPMVRKYLTSICNMDPIYPKALVSSIYYDSIDFRFLAEKLNSDFLKTKYRVRWYSDADTHEPSDVAFLEAKFRIGTSRVKRRVEIATSETKLFQQSALTKSEFPDIAPLLSSAGIHAPNQIFPVFIVNYNRLRLLEPRSGSRISIDTDINVPKLNTCFIPKTPTTALNTAVIEIKGKLDRIPEILYPIVDMGFRKTSFSKYSACFEKLLAFSNGIN